MLMRPGQRLTSALLLTDRRGIDGVVTGLGSLISAGSGQLRRVQTGFVRSYTLAMFGGALLVVLALLAVNLA
ncbi:MAG: hypothetical protein WKF83_16105 [Nocardioidaceae bacterium]